MAASEVDACDPSRLAMMRERFVSRIRSNRESLNTNTVCLTGDKYRSLVKEVLSAKGARQKQVRDYWLLKRYDVLVVDAREKLIVPLKNELSDVRYYVADEDLFEILHAAHVSLGHGGRDRMSKELRKKYKNITYKDIHSFLELCETCQQKQKSAKKGLVVKPMIFSEMNSRFQVDIIDYQSHPDDRFNFVMVYQDVLTRFVILNALETKSVEEVAYKLVDIFTLFGAPSVLHSENGHEFSNKVVERLSLLWPELKVVYGKPSNGQNHGGVERANQDIENMLTTWMQDNATDKWSEGLRFVQFMKNRAYHSGIKLSPYEAMFGRSAKLGLSTSCIPKDVLPSINTEEDLKKVLESVQNFHGDEANLSCNRLIEKELMTVENETNSCGMCQPEISGRGVTNDGPKHVCSSCRKRNITKNSSDDRRGQIKRTNIALDADPPPPVVCETSPIRISDDDPGHVDPHSVLNVVIEATDNGFY